MSHAFQVPDDLYRRLASLASKRGQTPDAFMIELASKALEADHIADDEEIELAPDDPLLMLSGFLDDPVEPGWADDHDAAYAGEVGDDGKP